MACVDRTGGHLERRGSHCHMARQTGVKEAGFSRLGLPKHPQEIDRCLSGWICNMELFDTTGFFADFPPHSPSPRRQLYSTLVSYYYSTGTHFIPSCHLVLASFSRPSFPSLYRVFVAFVFFPPRCRKFLASSIVHRLHCCTYLFP